MFYLFTFYICISIDRITYFLIQADCENYIRVLIKTSADEMFVCGTNAYKPKCRSYRRNSDANDYRRVNELDGSGLCPFDPRHNSTALHVDGRFYGATVADFASRDALIYRRPVRTVRNDPNVLNGEFLFSGLSGPITCIIP